MPKINFPSSPTVGQQHSEGGNTWEWTGSVWNLVCQTDPLPETTYIGVSPIDVDVVPELNGDKEVTISHENSGVTPGTYNKVTVNNKGHVTSGVNETTTYVGEGPISVDEQAVTGGKEVTISHDNSGVTPGTYNKVTVDAKGHITSAQNVDEQNNFVRVLRIPSTAINFSNDIKDEIVAYINQMNPPLVIDETDSKWNVVIDGIIQGVLDSFTEINVWFDNSGSMTSALEPIVNMVTSCLKDLLMPIYGDETTYNARVKVRSFTNLSTTVNGQSVSFIGKPNRNGQSAEERTLYMLDTLGSGPTITRVINFVFQDEAQSAYHEVPFGGTRTSLYDTDILALRTSLSLFSNPDYYYGVVYQLSSGSATDNAFKAFLQAVELGTGNFSGTNGLASYVSSGNIDFQYDLSKTGTSSYYLNLIRSTLVSLGFANVNPVEGVTCFVPITGTIATGCVNASGTNGTVNVTGVSGGSGSGYYFTLNGGVTQYVPGVGASGLADGNYTVRIYDGAGNNYALGTAVVSCYVAPPNTYNFNKYLCGTCTINGTGAVEFNAAVVVGKFYVLTNGEIAEITGLATNPVTHTLLDPLTSYNSCAEAPCP